jgi:hypothetical protein
MRWRETEGKRERDVWRHLEKVFFLTEEETEEIQQRVPIYGAIK